MADVDIKRIKALAHPLRAEILKTLDREDKPTSIKHVAEIIGQKPTKLHYHIRLLEEAGYIEVADTREINGITERFYQLTDMDPDVSLSYRENPQAVREVLPLLEHKALEIIRRIPTLDKDSVQLMGTIKECYFEPEHAAGAKQALLDLLEHKPVQLPEEADKETGENYDLMVFLVPRGEK